MDEDLQHYTDGEEDVALLNTIARTELDISVDNIAVTETLGSTPRGRNKAKRGGLASGGPNEVELLQLSEEHRSCIARSGLHHFAV